MIGSDFVELNGLENGTRINIRASEIDCVEENKFVVREAGKGGKVIATEVRGANVYYSGYKATVQESYDEVLRLIKEAEM